MQQQALLKEQRWNATPAQGAGPGSPPPHTPHGEDGNSRLLSAATPGALPQRGPQRAARPPPAVTSLTQKPSRKLTRFISFFKRDFNSPKPSAPQARPHAPPPQILSWGSNRAASEPPPPPPPPPSSPSPGRPLPPLPAPQLAHQLGLVPALLFRDAPTPLRVHPARAQGLLTAAGARSCLTLHPPPPPPRLCAPAKKRALSPGAVRSGPHRTDAHHRASPRPLPAGAGAALGPAAPPPPPNPPPQRRRTASTHARRPAGLTARVPGRCACAAEENWGAAPSGGRLRELGGGRGGKWRSSGVLSRNAR